MKRVMYLILAIGLTVFVGATREMDSECYQYGPYVGVAMWRVEGTPEQGNFAKVDSRPLVCNLSLGATPDNVGIKDWGELQGDACKASMIVARDGPAHFTKPEGPADPYTVPYDQHDELGPLPYQVTVCLRTNGNDGGYNPPNPAGVPEFSTVTIFLAIAGAGLGLALLRKN